MKRKNLLMLFAVLVFLYATSYLVFRQTHIEVWEQDKREYVIFPTGGEYLYYLFRPMTYMDSTITGMRFHIGSHR